MSTTAVLLLQMGGPDSLDAVAPFLRNLFADRDIIKIGPAWLQPVIARFIVKRRAPKVEENYRQIGGKSPLRELTEAQAKALEAQLGPGYRCFVAMRYWHPMTDETIPGIMDVVRQSGRKSSVYNTWEPLRDLARPGRLCPPNPFPMSRGSSCTSCAE